MVLGSPEGSPQSPVGGAYKVIGSALTVVVVGGLAWGLTLTVIKQSRSSRAEVAPRRGVSPLTAHDFRVERGRRHPTAPHQTNSPVRGRSHSGVRSSATAASAQCQLTSCARINLSA